MKNTTKKSPQKKTKSSSAHIKSAHKQTMQDIKTATLITSGLGNLFVLIGWMVLQTTSKYHLEVAQLLFG